MRRFGGSLLIALTLGMAALVAQSGGSRAASARPYTTWTAYQGGSHSAQYSALDQINKSNVSRLDVAWTYPVNGNITFNPIVVDGVMYVQGTANAIVALDAATGKEIWTHANQGGIGGRGLNYWESADRSDRRLLYLNAGHLTAINAQNGETITSFGTNGRVDLRVALVARGTQPAADEQPGSHLREPDHHLAARARGWLRSTPADVQAYDVRTGKIVWVFHSIPHPGEFGLRHVAGGRVQDRGRRAQLERADRRRAERHRVHSRSAPPASTSTAAIARGRTCSATAWWRSTRAPGSGSGTTSSCTTICGTTTCRRRRSC